MDDDCGYYIDKYNKYEFIEENNILKVRAWTIMPSKPTRCWLDNYCNKLDK